MSGLYLQCERARGIVLGNWLTLAENIGIPR